MPGSRGHAGDAAQQQGAPFPIVPLKDVIEMASLIDRRGGRCRFDELATALSQVRTSGAFRGRTAAGRMFGATETAGAELVLTDLGRRMISPDTEAEALAEAFLNVDLYRALFDRYAADGGKLPAVTVIDVDIERLHVLPQRASKARQVFLRSAETAGFFRSGRDRLIRPGRGSIATGRSSAPERKEPTEVSHAEAVPMPSPSLMQGLVAKLPPEGERYTQQQRQLWLETAKNILNLVYPDDDEGPDPALAGSNGHAGTYSQQS